MSLSVTLAHRLLEPVAHSDLERARLHLIDWWGCASAGTREPNAGFFRRLVENSERGNCPTMFGIGLPEAGAAFANGSLGNLLELDDTDRRGLVHPGDVVVPAVLAVACTQRATLRAALEAIVRGYEATIRLARAVGPGHYAYYHNTSTCGPFGAAAGVASILGADVTQCAHALGHAGSMAAGFWQLRHEKTATKQLHTAHAAHSGLMAARLAMIGAPGPLQILEGPQGFFAAMCANADPATVCQHLESPWLIHETTFKPWPSCRHTHVAIEAALQLRDLVDHQCIAELSFETFADAITFCDNAHPQTPHEGRFSLQHSIAIAMLVGHPLLKHFERDWLERADAQALRSRTSVSINPIIDSRYPDHMSGRLTATLTDGTVLVRDVVDALGDPEKPMSEQQIWAKCAALLEHTNGFGREWLAVEDALINGDLDETLKLPST